MNTELIVRLRDPAARDCCSQRTEAADALEAAQAENERHKSDWNRFHHVMKDHGLHPGRTDDDLIEVLSSALARLAEIERQEPVGFVHSGELQMIDLGYAHIYPKQAQGAQQPLYAAAGASPQPSQAGGLSDDQWQTIADITGAIITRPMKDAIIAAINAKGPDTSQKEENK